MQTALRVPSRAPGRAACIAVRGGMPHTRSGPRGRGREARPRACYRTDSAGWTPPYAAQAVTGHARCPFGMRTAPYGPLRTRQAGALDSGKAGRTLIDPFSTVSSTDISRG